MTRPYRIDKNHTTKRRVPRDIRNEIDIPKCWELYGHYNDMTAEELQHEIAYLKDKDVVYEDEVNFITDIGARKRSGLPIKPL